tara:strand:- start:940 stop:1851 length:912 start_codon:yes stop_codon:yes gene_type:complete
MKPYMEKQLNESTLIRLFPSTAREVDLKWHRDRQDRVVEVIHSNGWMLQRDDSVPALLASGDILEITANEWHRVVKGKGDLIVKIVESKKKKADGMRSIRKGADSNPKVTRMDFLPDDVLDDIASDKNESMQEDDNPHPSQYSAPEGSKRDKQLDKAKAAYKRGDVDKAVRIRNAMELDESVRIMESSELREVINDTVEEMKLDAFLAEIEDRLNEKKKRKKSSGGLSKAVKKSLNKKADKRCLTRGSVYSEFRAGLAAWLSSGSRKGMAQHQWAHARVNSANPSKKWAKVKKRKKCPKKGKK